MCNGKKEKILEEDFTISMGNGNNQQSYKASLEKVHKGSSVVRNALIRVLGPSERDILYPSHSLLSISILTLKQVQSPVLHSNC